MSQLTFRVKKYAPTRKNPKGYVQLIGLGRAPMAHPFAVPVMVGEDAAVLLVKDISPGSWQAWSKHQPLSLQDALLQLGEDTHVVNIRTTGEAEALPSVDLTKAVTL